MFFSHTILQPLGFCNVNYPKKCLQFCLSAHFCYCMGCSYAKKLNLKVAHFLRHGWVPFLLDCSYATTRNFIAKLHAPFPVSYWPTSATWEMEPMAGIPWVPLLWVLSASLSLSLVPKFNFQCEETIWLQTLSRKFHQSRRIWRKNWR